MKKLTLTVIICFFSIVVSHAQVLEKPFEGIITFQKMSLLDTNEYAYYAKGNLVRIDEIDAKTKVVAGSFLIDLKQSTMITLSHERKLYMDQKVELVTLVKDAVFLYPKKNSDGKIETIVVDKDESGNEIKSNGFYLTDEQLNWNNKKPYVVYGYAAVPENKTLNITAGARIHFHDNSFF